MNGYGYFVIKYMYKLNWGIMDLGYRDFNNICNLSRTKHYGMSQHFIDSWNNASCDIAKVATRSVPIYQQRYVVLYLLFLFLLFVISKTDITKCSKYGLL
jgi:hypothetical protein